MAYDKNTLEETIHVVDTIIETAKECGVEMTNEQAFYITGKALLAYKRLKGEI